MSDRAKEKAVERYTTQLYSVMPGAPAVPYDGEHGVYLWGKVAENEHWLFCKTVARMIVQNSALTYLEHD